MNNTIQNPHIKASKEILDDIIEKIRSCSKRYIITIAGESGCGKTETGKAFINLLNETDISALLINQDDYFVLPPASNDAKRKSDPLWIGPQKEVNLDDLETNLIQAKGNSKKIVKPRIDYDKNEISHEEINLEGIKVIVVEGTYTSLLKNSDTRIFITSNFKDTLPFRKKRNRGNEVNDSFVENFLIAEHKIIAGHRYLADYIITKEYEVKKTSC